MNYFDQWLSNIRNRRGRTLYPLGEKGLARIQIGPGQVCVIGGAPAAGKTAFAMQCTFDALRLTPSLNALVANVEMPVDALLDRQLARLSGVPLDLIWERDWGPVHEKPINEAIEDLREITPRLRFMTPPFEMKRVIEEASPGELVVLDYIQRFQARAAGEKRASLDNLMNDVRYLADQGAAMLVISAVGRQRSKDGNSNYDHRSLNLASFKESGEIEYGADSAYILAETAHEGRILKHCKARYTRMEDVSLEFDGTIQRFTACEDPSIAWRA